MAGRVIADFQVLKANTLPSASLNPQQLRWQGGSLWFSDGSAWVKVTPAAVRAISAGSGITVVESDGVVTLESGGAAGVEITGSSYTLGLQNINRFNRCNNGTAQSIVIPAQANVPWPDDIQLEGLQLGTGAVTFSGASGVTIRKQSTQTFTTARRYAPWGLRRLGVNEWWLFGTLGVA